MPTYTLKYTKTTEDQGSGNTQVTEIFRRYRNDNKIISSTEDTSNGVTTQVITFADQASYDEWYAEIDAIDTTPPTGVTFVGTGVYAP